MYYVTIITLQPDDEHLHEDDKFLLQQLLGALLYLALCTRPDIASAVRAVATHVSEPTHRHLTAAKRILRYVKGTKTLFLTYTRGRQARQLISFCDASWGEDQSTRRSTTDPRETKPASKPLPLPAAH